ncbi:hypothetical protein KR074_007352 [Drosophila pseudoananassae]|nr:hypothetical protein KR074_007352 [Drosophila pseudoananassae]
MDIYITKGIINPNYPGFQKFAHTLSDEYIEYSDMECNESDLTDSDREEEQNTYNTKVARISESKACENTQDLILKNDEKHGVDNGNTYLFDKTVNSSTTANIPDLVNENYKPASETPIRTLNKPDLIYNLSKNCVNNSDFSPWLCTKYEGQLQGQSPIDIVGDFGGEVEREFELLITGYKNKTKHDVELNELNLTKICDAELSNGTEALKQSQSSRFSGPSIRKNKKKNTPYGHEMTKSKHHKPSHDERQLPPDTFDYKICNQRKPCHPDTESYSSVSEKIKCDTQNMNHVDVPNLSNLEIGQSLQEEKKPSENRRYQSPSCWSQYLEGPKKFPKVTSSAVVLEQFDAYKVANDMDMETLQNHVQKVKQIEKKRRFNRDEIRKRLAIGDKDQLNNITQNNKEEFLTGSDNESSDSETCPKLSSGMLRKQSEICETKRITDMDNNKSFLQNQVNQPCNITHTINGNPIQSHDFPSNENDFFFAKQSKLQIEVRIALAQSKEIAQMKVKAKKHGVTPIVDVIRSMLCDVGINMNSNHRWISRQLLTGIDVPTLQLLVNNLQIYIENLNVTLVESLKERDDLNSDQDDILHDLEKINNFL